MREGGGNAKKGWQFAFPPPHSGFKPSQTVQIWRANKGEGEERDREREKMILEKSAWIFMSLRLPTQPERGA